jgi:hypothetical protein
MRYLCGHGLALRLGVAEIEGGMVARAAVDVGSAEKDSSGGIDGGNEEAVRERIGVLFVGPGFT